MQLQQDATDELVARRGWHLVDTYVDHGVSGARARRPELNRLLADAKRGRLDLLVVYRSDRLFRSIRHMITTLDDLASMGIGFASVAEPFDTSTPSGKLLLHMVAAMAEFERSLLIERTKAGVEAAVRRGKKVGRPRVQVDVERAGELRAEGKTYVEVAAALGVGVATGGDAASGDEGEQLESRRHSNYGVSFHILLSSSNLTALPIFTFLKSG